MVPRSLLLLAAILVGGPGPGWMAQETLAQPHAETQKVRLVLLPTSVTGNRGKPIRGLGRKDFRLLDDGQPREIEVFATEGEAPIALAILLDLSGSMGLQGKLERAKSAIRTLVETLGPEDKIGLIGFADSQVTWITEFTADQERFLQRVEVQEAYGPTALFDALAATPELVADQIHGRKAIVLITDGLDNASELPMLEAVWIARRVNVPIYTLGYIPLDRKILPRRGRDSLRFLDRFTSETGGHLFAIHDSQDLSRAVARIQKELRFQYLIGFYSDPAVRDGGFRPIRLELIRDQARIRTRRGYYAHP